MLTPFRRLVIALLLLGIGRAAHAQGVAVDHVGSILGDQKGQALKDPEGVACGGAGTVVVADTGNGRLLRFVFADRHTTGGTEVRLPEVTYPTHLQLAADGSLYVLDGKKKRIAHLDAAGKLLGFVTVPGSAPGSGLVGSFALDREGLIYVHDLIGNRVQVVDAAGKAVRSLQLPDPNSTAIVDLAVDSAGAVLAIDAREGVVWVADKAATAFKPLTKSLKQVMSFPGAIAVAKGRILIVDQSGNGLVLLGADGTFLGRRLAIGWTEGLVRYPAQVCVTEAGDLYLADRQNNRVQAFLLK